MEGIDAKKISYILVVALLLAINASLVLAQSYPNAQASIGAANVISKFANATNRLCININNNSLNESTDNSIFKNNTSIGENTTEAIQTELNKVSSIKIDGKIDPIRSMDNRTANPTITNIYNTIIIINSERNTDLPVGTETPIGPGGKPNEDEGEPVDSEETEEQKIGLGLPSTPNGISPA